MKLRRSLLTILCAVFVSGSSLAAAEPRLASAVERQDDAAVRRLLDEKVDVNAAQPDGMTALHWAVFRGNLDMTRTLLEAGAHVDAANRYRVTPLSIACSSGNAEIVQLLLEHGADPNSTLPGGETPLMTAARTGRPGTVKALLAKGAKVQAKESGDQTALMWAAAEGHLAVVDLLLAAGADADKSLDSGFNPLFFAVREGRIDVVRRLLETGIDASSVMRSKRAADDKGTSALVLAIENGHFELAVLLLEAGADPNDLHTGFSPLHTMSWVRKPPIGDNAAGAPPPIGSGRLSSLQCVRALVEHGADVNLRLPDNAGRGIVGRKGSTPFLCAAGTADLAFMQTLLELGADPTIPNQQNQTALMLAAGMGAGSSGDEAGTEDECLKAVRFLIELGADVNATDRSGETAMHGAAYRMMPKVVTCLAEHGADVRVWSQPSKEGRMPLWIALGYRGGGNFKPSYETAAVLEQLMIDEGLTPPPPPEQKLEKGYKAN